jgi:hypothetical protein
MKKARNLLGFATVACNLFSVLCYHRIDAGVSKVFFPWEEPATLLITLSMKTRRK